MIERSERLNEIRTALKRSRAVAVIGPRQSGKTTLARLIVSGDSINYFDLEDPVGASRLAEPMTALKPLKGIVVIDEIQRRPDLFPVLRVLADRRPLPARFLILGSASPALIRHSAETLAGRIETVVLSGFTLAELGARERERHWRRGGFPPSFLARSDKESIAWRRRFLRTFFERDLPLMGSSLPPETLLRFFTMIAHMHGGVWNAADPARSLGVSEPTVRRYLDLFAGLFLIRQLQPWYENLGKRQVKSPKVYVRDSGILHALLGLRTQRELLSHPKVGASWEGYVVEELLNIAKPDAAYFWATHTGAELDLLLLRDNKRYGVEVKFQDAPKLTPSMRIAFADLKLDHLTVVYPGDKSYLLADRVKAVPADSLASGTAHTSVIPSKRTLHRRSKS